MYTENKRPWIVRFLADYWLFLLVLGALIILPHAIGWLTDSSPFGVQRGSRTIMQGRSAFWQAVFIEVFALSILVMSYNLMFGFTGVISFGHALFFGLGGYSIGMLWQYTGLEPNLALLLGVVTTIVLTGGVGLAIGLVSLRLRGIYFAIFTLGVAEMVWIYVGRWPLTGGEDGFSISDLPAWIDPSQNRLNLYYIGLALFVFTFCFIYLLVKSPTGSVFQAIRENEERAKTIGYNTLRFKLFSITAASVLAGLAGMLHAILNKKLGPEMFGVTHTVDALLMSIIGGVGTFVGPVIGAGGLHITDVLLRDADITLNLLVTEVNIGDSWTLILGLIFIVVVMVFPFGIVGTFYRLRRWLRARFDRSPPQDPTPTPAAQSQPGEAGGLD
jgi:branched-chain amino acid transport system permease protein